MIRTTGLVVLLLGTVVTVVGTFAPWLRSGRTTRNSFQVAGTADRFDLLDNGLLRAVVENWALIGPILIIPLTCAALRWWLGGAVAAILVGLLVAGLAITVMVAVGDRRILTIELVATGPVTVVVGGILIAVAGALIMLSRRRDTRLGW